MTADLKATLHHRAESVAFRPPDLAAIRRSGDQRIRGRRSMAAVAGTVALVLVGGAVFARGIPDRNAFPSPWPQGAVTWATGSTIHIGTDTVDIGHTVAAYVRTSAGFAAIDGEDDVYSVTGEGVSRIGHAAAAPPSGSDAAQEPRIVADTGGTLVGWVGDSRPGGWTMWTYDQATGKGRSYRVPTDLVGDVVTRPWVEFVAIDGRTGYWHQSSMLYAVDLDTGKAHQMPVPETGPDIRGLYSVENGVLAFRRADPTGELDAIFTGRSFADAREMVRQGEKQLTIVTTPIRLSPAGAWLSLGLEHLTKVAEGNFHGTSQTADVYNTTSGEHVMLRVAAAGGLVRPVFWLNDKTVQVLVVSSYIFNNSPVVDIQTRLYACTVPEGSCRPAADAGTAVVWKSPEPGWPALQSIPVMPDGLSSPG